MNYLKFVIYTLTHDIPDNPYNGERTQWQRKISRLFTRDGPIHTMWSWYNKIRYNWFTIGWHCWRTGHDWADQFVTTAPQTRLITDKPGYARFERTGKTELYYARVCASCGKFQGIDHKER